MNLIFMNTVIVDRERVINNQKGCKYEDIVYLNDMGIDVHIVDLKSEVVLLYKNNIERILPEQHYRKKMCPSSNSQIILNSFIHKIPSYQINSTTPLYMRDVIDANFDLDLHIEKVSLRFNVVKSLSGDMDQLSEYDFIDWYQRL